MESRITAQTASDQTHLLPLLNFTIIISFARIEVPSRTYVRLSVRPYVRAYGRLWIPLVPSVVASGRLWSPLVASGRLWYSIAAGRYCEKLSHIFPELT